ncbi:hypothetical protein ACVR0S_08745 [Streptococcus dentapri]|uniref:Uncharacterized protein n=1 Tax=Streptococcus dentapri TaxID=573564 RepID=A0ABV8D230_9STRE
MVHGDEDTQVRVKFTVTHPQENNSNGVLFIPKIKSSALLGTEDLKLMFEVKSRLGIISLADKDKK